MTALEKLRARLKDTAAAIKTIVEKDDPSAEDVTSLETKTAEIAAIEADILKFEAAEKAMARAAQPANDPVPTADGLTTRGHNGGPAIKGADDAVVKVGLLAIATAKAALGEYPNAIKALAENGYGQVADEFALHTARAKSLNASVAASGGILVPDVMSDQIIEFLRPQTAFLRGGPRRIAMPNGNWSQPGGATGATASYGTELSNAAVTEGTFRDIEMVAKELKALIPMSNQFLEFSIASARGFVEADLRDEMSETLDVNMFRGDGGQGRPLGIYNIPGIGTNAATNSTTPTIAQVDSDLRKAINYLTTRNVPLGSAAWIIGRRALGYLEDLRDGNSNIVFPTLMQANPTLKRIRVLDTTNLPENLGGSSNEGVIGLVAFNHVLFGETTALEFKASKEAAYTDAGGTMRSAFQRGETLIMALMRHDTALRHLPAVHTLTAVKYGA